MHINIQISKTTKIILALAGTLFILSLFFINKYYFLNPSYLSGDEPHYVMMTDSLSKDGDFNLRNDYELGRSTAYYPVPGLFPHVSPTIDLNSKKWYSIHTIGLPIVLYPAYKSFGLMGSRIWIMVLQLALIPIFYLILKKYVRSKEQVYLGTGLLAVCPLFWQNLGSLFPDLLLVTLWGSMILLFDKYSIRSSILMALLLLLTGLVHTKGLVLVLPLVIFQATWQIQKNGFTGWLKKYWAMISVLVVGLVSYVYYLYSHYGIISPTGLYGNNGQLFSANPVYNFVATLIDRNKGLFVYFPILGILGVYLYFGVVELYRTVKKIIKKSHKISTDIYLLFGVLSGLVLLFITLIGFNDWSGSTGPNGRSMLPFVVFAIFLIARYSNLRNRLEAIVIYIASAVCLWLSWLSIVDFRNYMSPGQNSFWVSRFPTLTRLPMFNLTSNELGRGPLVRGIKILLVILVLNICFYVICRYKITLKKRKLNF